MNLILLSIRLEYRNMYKRKTPILCIESEYLDPDTNIHIANEKFYLVHTLSDIKHSLNLHLNLLTLGE